MGTLGDVDKVRLGRALGYGTRHAAKTLAAVAEAAAAPNPRGVRADAGSGEGNGEGRRGERPRVRRIPAAGEVRQLGRSVWRPIAVFSNVLWLRVTGTFFALIAFAMSSGAWRLRELARAGWNGPGAGSSGAHRFWVFAGFGALFAYFAVSSFVRASVRERRAAAAR